MKLYRQQPADDVLIDYAFAKYPDAQRITFYGQPVFLANDMPDTPMRTLTHQDRADGVAYTFSAAHLWALMKRDHEQYDRLLPHGALREYVDA